MPGQVFQVLQCYSCLTYQVQQKKKVNKWSCKMCGEKQSIKKIYGEGSGADCRVHVQKLNSLRGELEIRQQSINSRHTDDTQSDISHGNLMTNGLERDQQVTSRWSQFCDRDAGGEEEEEEELWTTNRQTYNEHVKQVRKRRKIDAFERGQSLESPEVFSKYSHQKPRLEDNLPPSCHVPQDHQGNQLQEQDTFERRKQRATCLGQSAVTMVTKKTKSGPPVSVQTNSAKSKWSTFIEEKEECEDSDENEFGLGVDSTQGGSKVYRVSDKRCPSQFLKLNNEYRPVDAEQCENLDHQGEVNLDVKTQGKYPWEIHLKDENITSIIGHNQGNIPNDVKSSQNLSVNKTVPCITSTISVQMNNKSPSSESIFTLGDVDEEDLKLDLEF